MKLFIVALLAAVAAGSAAAQGAASSLDVPAGNKPFLDARAVGVQIYSCNGSAWTLLAPRATLYGKNGKRVATHFAGPTWQAADGSRVVGRAVARATYYPTAIPWLLLEATSTAAGPQGDRLAHTTYIQRLNTTGGLAPAADCGADTAGSTTEGPYTADYYFWKSTRD
jgi:hypothetical protein